MTIIESALCGMCVNPTIFSFIFVLLLAVLCFPAFAFQFPFEIKPASSFLVADNRPLVRVVWFYFLTSR